MDYLVTSPDMARVVAPEAERLAIQVRPERTGSGADRPRKRLSGLSARARDTRPILALGAVVIFPVPETAN